MVRFGTWLRKSHWIVALLALLVVLALRRSYEWRAGEWAVVFGIFALWAFLGFAGSFFRRLGIVDSLVTLDRRGGWKDRFSSAWAFLQDANRSEAQDLHIERSGKVLPDALNTLRDAIPLPVLNNVWIAPLLALAFAFSPLLRVPLASSDKVLTKGMRDAAALQADELKKEGDRIEGLDSLTEEEKEELESLRAEVDEVAQSLQNSEGMTAGEMLEALETRARAAERLAEKLGLADNDWASEEMLAEMAVHPDTADLSLAVKDKAADPAAEEATRLQGVLENDDIQPETQDRITRALESVMQAALEVDLTKPVGERMGNASRKMVDAQPLTAAREFEELAKHFRLIESREEARDKLESLANSLREAGSEISGSELEKMEEIAGSSEGEKSAEGQDGQGQAGGLKPLDSDLPKDLQKLLSPQMAQSGQQPGQSPSTAPPANPNAGNQPGPVPGSSPGKNDETGENNLNSQQSLMAPVPGEAPPQGQSGSGMSMTEKARDGKGKGGMLSAPVPGMAPGEVSPGAGMSGQDGATSQQGQGGNEAGNGTAELVDNETDAIKAAKDAQVFADVGKEGDSTFRAIEGEARAEKAQRSRQEVMTEFLAVEEQALDGQAIPLSRKQHVLRYFSAIRKQFEDSETAE